MTSPASDPAQPAAARIYDYLLGGKDNYAVDRAAAEKGLAVAPDQRRLARANRAFAIRAVRVLAEAGIRQFIDLGSASRSCTWCRTATSRRGSWRGTATACALAATSCSPSSPATATPGLSPG